MKQEAPKVPFLPKEYSWMQMIGIGLAVLSIGLAIAFTGFYFLGK